MGPGWAPDGRMGSGWLLGRSGLGVDGPIWGPSGAHPGSFWGPSRALPGRSRFQSPAPSVRWPIGPLGRPPKKQKNNCFTCFYGSFWPVGGSIGILGSVAPRMQSISPRSVLSDPFMDDFMFFGGPWASPGARKSVPGTSNQSRAGKSVPGTSNQPWGPKISPGD